jgi:3''-phosphoadenosine 5''-phosphosulfate sulfotransferase (PAPS reductase)/FAD synthetase and related enzymes
MCNKDIRDYARIKDVRLWKIADKLNLCDSNFSRLLRHELSDEKKAEIKDIIDKLASEQ